MGHKPFPCPRCRRLLPPSGEIVAESTFPVYQCDACTVDVVMFGKAMTLPLTFAVGTDGKPYDPADDSPL